MGKRLAFGEFSLRACVFGFSGQVDMNNQTKATTGEEQARLLGHLHLLQHCESFGEANCCDWAAQYQSGDARC